MKQIMTMKLLGFWAFIIGLNFYGCNQTNSITVNKDEQQTISDESKDKKQIQLLIRNVLNWANSGEAPINLLPILVDNKAHIHFDLSKHKKNLQKLKETKFFTKKFIDNYNQTILTLDKGLKHGSYGKYRAGEMPAISFTNEVDPWTLCQDVPYDKPKPWNFIEIEVLSLEDVKGELNWKWGKLEPDTDPGWKEFRYRFKVVKESNQWKIDYLQGFDFRESTKKAGL